jgi:hypothetical protein
VTQAVDCSAGSGSAQLRDDLLRFERGDIDPARFNHEAHIRMAFAMSMHYAFDAALARFATALRLMCSRQGAPEKYNMTITATFLSLVAERCAAKPDITWAEFAATHQDLLDKRCLEKWYDKALLGSELARQTFILPRPIGPSMLYAGTAVFVAQLAAAAPSGNDSTV